MSELLNCPFCSYAGMIGIINNHYYVHCENCTVQVGCYEKESDAIKRWNTRADSWLPIESAPKEFGHYILIWTGRSVELVTWDDKDFLWDSGDNIFINPTHWMPLPKPPKEEV